MLGTSQIGENNARHHEAWNAPPMPLNKPRHCEPATAGVAIHVSNHAILEIKTKQRGMAPALFHLNLGLKAYEQPVVEPQVSHFKQVPLRTSVKFAHSGQASPT